MLSKFSFHCSGDFSISSVSGLDDPLTRHTTINAAGGKQVHVTVVGVPEALGGEIPTRDEFQEAVRAAPAAVYVLSRIVRDLPVDLVQKLARVLRSAEHPLAKLTSERLFCHLSGSYLRQVRVAEASPLPSSIDTVAQGLERTMRWTSRVFGSVDDDIWLSLSEIVLSHLLLRETNVSAVAVEAMARRVTSLVVGRAVALVDYAGAVMDLPNRSAGALAYLLGLTNCCEALLFEELAIALFDRHEGAVLPVIRRLFRCPPDVREHERRAWEQAVARAISEVYRNPSPRWRAGVRSPTGYIWRAAQKIFVEDYAGGGNTKVADALFRSAKRDRNVLSLEGEQRSAKDLEDILRRKFGHARPWRGLSPLGEMLLPESGSPVARSTASWADIDAAIDITKLEGKHAITGGDLEALLERYGDAERDNRLRPLPKRVERARPFIRQYLQAYLRPKK